MKQYEQTFMLTFKCFTFLLLILVISGCTPSTRTPEPNHLPPQALANEGGASGGVLPEGTKVDDLDLSGMVVPEASLKLEEWAKDKLEETRVLLYNNTEIPITLKDLGIDVDHQKTMEEVENTPGQTLPSVLKADSLKANQTLQEKLVKIARPAKDASYKIENDKFVINPAESGRTVVIDRLIRDIQKISLSDVPKRLDIPVVEVPASVTTESINTLAFDTVIGESTTKFSVSEGNRSANLTAAAKALDRKVIRPGETFSFNDTVGPREPETGYKEAYVIINGEYVKGTGGGVCQVSSTLYNAVLLSNLKIVERMPHAVAVSYVLPGQDATVNYPNIDFKFNNDTSNLLYLRSNVKSGVLTLQIWGKKLGKSVRIERQVEKIMNYKTEKRTDRKLPAGRIVQEQKGSKGVVVNTWRVIRDGNGNETKQFLGRDLYAPANRILRVGSRGLSET
ncbi:VanW family protein [Desulfosporosinus sp. Sb-LF]|uniref:VanW family protein n=1 Tax=Desulfosporosinus sp. Sb-LF TaxID=2560027 RepID=UPI00107F7057|nr:VanW family protein [Desulfosporosinus sp. Sb-LF]TGE34630.1 vancomycin resistance protein [Desulfosporosinus sp. Sb-LF]